jgi:hypothetical protein
MKNRLSIGRRRIRTNASLATALLAALVAAAGCSSSGTIESGPEYPNRAAGSVDIQVVRDETVIRMTNTTARNLPAGRLWINRWYSHDFPGLAIGDSVTMDLSQFKDQYGDTFRAGGYFATDRPTKVVQAQLETESELIGFVVVGNQE